MSWYDTDWDYRVEITVDNTQVDGDVSDFPVYVDLSDMPESFFTNVDSAGADIRITRSDGTTECAFEIVAIDTSAKTGELHFKANFLSSSSDTSFKIYYGNAGASAYAVDATYGSNNVWTNGYICADHMQSTTGDDSTGNAGSKTATGSPSTTAGKLSGNAVELSGLGQYMSFSDFAELAGMGAYSVSFWVNLDSDPSNTGFISHCSASFADRNIYVVSTSSQGLLVYASSDGTGLNDGQIYENSSSVLGTGSWQHVYIELILGGTETGAFFLDDVSQTFATKSEDGAGFPAATRDGAGNLYIGCLFPGNREMNGKIDEIRISDTARSNAWKSAEYTNQNTPTTFYTVGSEEAQPTADTFTPKTSIF